MNADQQTPGTRGHVLISNVSESERRPDRVIATEYETISNSVDDRFHSFAICLDASSTFIMKTTALWL